MSEIDDIAAAADADHMAAMELSELCAEQKERIADLEQQLADKDDYWKGVISAHEQNAREYQAEIRTLRNQLAQQPPAPGEPIHSLDWAAARLRSFCENEPLQNVNVKASRYELENMAVLLEKHAAIQPTTGDTE